MQEVEATIINGKGTETGHIIVTTTGGKNGQPKQVCDFTAFDEDLAHVFGVGINLIIETLDLGAMCFLCQISPIC
jgi:hypothetical protein